MLFAIKQVYRPAPGERLRIRFVDTSNGQVINNLAGYTILEQGAFNFGKTVPETQAESTSTSNTNNSTQTSNNFDLSRNDGFDRGGEFLSKEGPVPGVTDLKSSESITNSIERTPENNFGWTDMGLEVTDFIPGINVITGLIERTNNLQALDAMREYYGLERLSGTERFQAFINPNRTEFARIGPFTDLNGNKYFIDPRNNLKSSEGLNIAKPQNMTRDKLIDVPHPLDEQTNNQAMNQVPNQNQGQSQQQQQAYKDIWEDPGFLQKLAEDPNASSLLQAMGYQYEKPGSVPQGGFVNPYVGTQEALALSNKINEIADRYKQDNPQYQTKNLEQTGNQNLPGRMSPEYVRPGEEFQASSKGSQIQATPPSEKTINAILGEALAGDWNDYKAVASGIFNRSNQLGVPPDDVLIPDQVNAVGKPLPEGVEKFRDLAIKAWNEVQTQGPIHNGTFWATPATVNNLPKGLQEETRTNGHIYFSDPQNRSIKTAQGYVVPGQNKQTSEFNPGMQKTAPGRLSPEYVRPEQQQSQTQGAGFMSSQAQLARQAQAVPQQTGVTGRPNNPWADMNIPSAPANRETGFAVNQPVNPFSNFNEAGQYTGNQVNPNAGFMDMKGYVNASPRPNDPLAGITPRMERSFLYDNMGTSPMGAGLSKNVTNQNIPQGFIEGVISGYNALRDMSNDPMGGQFIRGMRDPENQKRDVLSPETRDRFKMENETINLDNDPVNNPHYISKKDMQDVLDSLTDKFGKDKARSYFADFVSGMAGTSRGFTGNRNDNPFDYLFSSSTDRVSGLSQGGFLSPSVPSGPSFGNTGAGRGDAPSGPVNTGSTSGWNGADAPSGPGGYSGDFGGGPQSTGGDRPGGSSNDNGYGDWGGWASGFDSWGAP